MGDEEEKHLHHSHSAASFREHFFLFSFFLTNVTISISFIIEDERGGLLSRNVH